MTASSIALPDVGAVRSALAVPGGEGFDVGAVDTRATPGFDGDKAAGRTALAAVADEIAGLQERLYARHRAGVAERAVLLVLQGMDTSGKGGIVRHVVGAADPQGVMIRGFKAPTDEERAHGFLWRIRRALPTPGHIGVFDRSHYEDVLVVRVEDLVPEEEWRPRYDLINVFEGEVAASGTSIVKVMLHISRDEQRDRLAERLDRPDKHWKYNPDDLRARARWDDYLAAYSEALARCSTPAAPWYVVPADRKWYARLAVATLLLGALRDLELEWPPADFDVETEKARLAAS
jgi:PPK2 family polyphosphate:nucleotide phosphotransferase